MDCVPPVAATMSLTVCSPDSSTCRMRSRIGSPSIRNRLAICSIIRSLSSTIWEPAGRTFVPCLFEMADITEGPALGGYCEVPLEERLVLGATTFFCRVIQCFTISNRSMYSCRFVPARQARYRRPPSASLEFAADQYVFAASRIVTRIEGHCSAPLLPRPFLLCSTGDAGTTVKQLSVTSAGGGFGKIQRSPRQLSSGLPPTPMVKFQSPRAR